MNSELLSDLRLSTLAPLYASGTAQPEDIINLIYDRIESAPVLSVWISLVPRTEALSRARHLKLSNPGRSMAFPSQ